MWENRRFFQRIVKNSESFSSHCGNPERISTMAAILAFPQTRGCGNVEKLTAFTSLILVAPLSQFASPYPAIFVTSDIPKFIRMRSPVILSLFLAYGLCHTEAFQIHFQDHTVVDKAVDSCCCHHRTFKNLFPF